MEKQKIQTSIKVMKECTGEPVNMFIYVFTTTEVESDSSFPIGSTINSPLRNYCWKMEFKISVSNLSFWIL